MSNQRKKQSTTRNRALWNPEQATNEELEILEVPHLDAITRDREIQNILRTKELQELIRNIDKSKCRLEALAAAQHNIPQFKDFCEKLLGVVYQAEDEKNSYHS